MIRTLVLCLLALIPVTALAYECDTTVTYDTCQWITTICYPDGYCDGYWECDTNVTTVNVTWATYPDWSHLYRQLSYNQYGQLVSCRRWCDCPNPNDCDAKDNFGSSTLSCPAQ